MMRVCVGLAVLAALATPSPRQSEPLIIAIIGPVSPSVSIGLDFGAAELSQTVRLLGREVRLVTGETDVTALAGAVVSDGWEGAPPKDVPSIRIGFMPAASTRCEFSVAPAPDANRRLEPWHASLNRFGASELNERFQRKHHAPMTTGAWLGWVALKALGEAALRRRPGEDRCESLARLRFDGHKGRPLYFDPATRVLSQPLYIVQDGRVVEEIK